MSKNVDITFDAIKINKNFEDNRYVVATLCAADLMCDLCDFTKW